MIDEQSVLGVILARGGSKGLPRKNIRDLAGKPLIAWTIEVGHESEHLDRLVLSSDDGDIIEVAEKYGCEVPFRRPSHLAQDDTPSMDALLHTLKQVESHDYVVLLQPTSPLRTVDDVDGTIARCHGSHAPACVTVTETDILPQRMYALDDDRRLRPVCKQDEEITRRQDAPDTYTINGAVYVARTDWLKKEKSFITDVSIAYKMPKHSSVDINDEVDLLFANSLVKSKTNEI